MKRRQFVFQAVERQQRFQFHLFLAVVSRKREILASQQMPEIETILIHNLHCKDSRADVFILPEIFDKLYGGFLHKLL